MSDVILTNWTVYYSSDTGGDQQIRWTGTTGTNTVNELYSALQDLFDRNGQMDDGTPMSAQTPTAYTIGTIDAGDTGAWFIDPESIKHLTGGSLQTSSWTRVLDSNRGIYKIATDGANIVPADVGNAISHADGDDGVLLYVDTVNNELWVRPDTSAVGDDFSASSGNITCNGNTDVQSSAATTGEMIWSNIYTLGTIESNTALYVAQNNSVISNSEDSGSSTWWSPGHFDILVATTDQDTLIDRGLLTIYARQYSKKYSYFVSDVSAGGRTPIPLSTSDDPNNETGYREMVLTTASADFTVGEIIEDDSDSTIQGIVTSNSGTAPNITLQYYLVSPDLNDFTGATGGFTGQTSSSTGTAVAPTSVGPAALAMTITFGLNQTFDIDNDSTNEDYSIVIDLASTITLTDMNERLKYITRRGETSTLDGIEGQQYIGIDYRVDYNAGGLTGTIADGSTVTQTLADGSTATTEVVAHDTTDEYMMLRDTRGILEVGSGAANLEIDGSNYVDMTGTASATVVSPSLEHPFGVFAGGRFFGTRGVVLDNVLAADANDYELVDNAGNAIIPPQSIALTVDSVVSGDRVTMFRATGDNNTVDKTIYTSTASGNNAGDADLVVQETIANDTPSSGVVRIVNNSGDGTEQRYRYTSWATSTFTLVTGASGSATAGSSGQTLVDSGADFGGTDDIEVGDRIRNTTTSESGRVKSITNSTTIVTAGLSSGWTSGDNYDTNVLDRGYDGSDTAYAPFIDQEATSTSVAVSVTYVSDRYVTTRVRRIGILPFKVKGQVTTAGLTVTAIRTTDDIVDLPG